MREDEEWGRGEQGSRSLSEAFKCCLVAPKQADGNTDDWAHFSLPLPIGIHNDRAHLCEWQWQNNHQSECQTKRFYAP